jgi:antitoxin (DNA-binding transcriptional repressor) of toxin-antitoxin stability system
MWALLGARLAQAAGIQALAQLLTSLEEGDVFILDKDCIPGARVAPLPRRAMLYGEGAETAKLHPVPTRQGTGDLIEHDVDDAFDITMEEMRICGRHLLNQLGFDHCTAPLGLALNGRKAIDPPSAMQGAKRKQDRQA